MFTFTSRIGYFPEARILEAVFPRGLNLVYKSQAQARGFLLSHKILPEAHPLSIFEKDAILLMKIFYVKWLFWL